MAVRQAILGLLIFAIDASGGGAIRIAVDGEDARVSLRIQVRPEPGQKEGERAGDDSNLAVSRRLVELQGGAFTLLASGQALEIALSLPAASPKLVLIVDDNADTLQLFTHYLEAQAYRVVTASTGEEALRVVAEKRPDAVVLDVMLPSADGYEVLQSLRSDPETAGVPVVVCTVLKQRELALSLGATEFLPKPATQGDLLAALDRCWS